MDEKTKAVFETWSSAKFVGQAVRGEDVEELYQAFKHRFVEDFFSKAPEPDPANPYGVGVVNLAANKVNAEKVIEEFKEVVLASLDGLAHFEKKLEELGATDSAMLAHVLTVAFKGLLKKHGFED